MKRPDRWTVVELLGAGLLGGGVWAQWGPQWACMLWGLLLLGVAALRAATEMMIARATRRPEE